MAVIVNICSIFPSQLFQNFTFPVLDILLGLTGEGKSTPYWPEEFGIYCNTKNDFTT